MTATEISRPTMGLLAELERNGAIATDQGLHLPHDLSYERYEAIGALLRFAGDAINWYIGDWLIFGEHTYGMKFSQAAEILGLHPQTLMNIQRVARGVPPQRRRLSVRHSHHEVVAALPPNDQRRLLKKVETERLTRDQLRRVVQTEKGETPPAERGVCGECGRPYA